MCVKTVGDSQFTQGHSHYRLTKKHLISLKGRPKNISRKNIVKIQFYERRDICIVQG